METAFISEIMYRLYSHLFLLLSLVNVGEQTSSVSEQWR